MERTEQCQWEEVKQADLIALTQCSQDLVSYGMRSEKDIRIMGKSSVITLSVSNSSSGTQQLINREIGNPSMLPLKMVRGLHELM